MAIFAIFITGCEARQTFSDDTLIGTPTPAPPTERQVKLIDSGPERGYAKTVYNPCGHTESFAYK